MNAVILLGEIQTHNKPLGTIDIIFEVIPLNGFALFIQAGMRIYFLKMGYVNWNKLTRISGGSEQFSVTSSHAKLF